jgi:rubredoxin
MKEDSCNNGAQPIGVVQVEDVPRRGAPAIQPDFEEGIMDKYECTMCEYTYDPAQGDPKRGIPPGTPFDSLPDNWTCPKCGAGKNMFEAA